MACATPKQPESAPPAPLRLTTDSTAYHRKGQSALAVSFTITNAGPATVYVMRCNGSAIASLDRIDWVGWRVVEGAQCNGGSITNDALPPGTSFTGSTRIYEGGSYRLRLSADPDPDSEKASLEVVSKTLDVY